MTGGPSPVAGSNPYVGTYQAKQFDTTWPPAEGVLEALADPPEAAIEAAASPDKVFDLRENPPVGADGNTGGGGII